MKHASEYVQHYKRGPFPDQIDLWGEIGYYFQQIHSGMIDNLLAQTQDVLLGMGYIAGKEASLQIAEGREPDIFVQRAMNIPEPELRWDYDTAAEEILADAGVMVEANVDLQALHIKHAESGRLVTVVEIISPNNKIKPESIRDYQQRRERLLFERGVNVVEIDPTRSIKRLLTNGLTIQHHYHIAIYLPGESPRVIGLDYGQALSRIALPLRGEVVPMELQKAYTHAYELATIGGQIHNDGRYTESDLPFPSLVTDEQRSTALDAVKTWQARLAELK